MIVPMDVNNYQEVWRFKVDLFNIIKFICTFISFSVGYPNL